jgi:Ni,Fe-hydrogenase I small subunit
MAITRRQFVTTLGAMAAAVGVAPDVLGKVTETLALPSPWTTWPNGKPKVIWVHGAECTGCSTSLLGLFEDATGKAVEGTAITTLDALGLVTGSTSTVPRTLQNAGLNVDGVATVVNIQDVLLDIIDLQYHETVMGAGGDLAYQMLNDNMANGSALPFILVVEGAVQVETGRGAWPATTATYSWCSVGQGLTSGENKFGEVVSQLTQQDSCLAVISIGQCASFGGYPACVSPKYGKVGDAGGSQTPAYSVYNYFAGSHSNTAESGAMATTSALNSPAKVQRQSMATAASKVINVPGCPPNPWWFVLTVVLYMIDAGAVLSNGFTQDGPLGILKKDLSILPGSVDSTRRLKMVYGTAMHGGNCKRYPDYAYGKFAAQPGDAGCLLLLGCKGPSTNSLCTLHGWNGQQPHNDATLDYGVRDAFTDGSYKGGNCTAAGHPCMACTERGYPDQYVPFVTFPTA